MAADIIYLQQSQQEINQLETLFARQHATCLAQPMPDAMRRVQWPKALRGLLFKEQQALIEAIDRDFNTRSADGTLLAKIMFSLHGIHYAVKCVRKWMKPVRRTIGLQFQPAPAQVVYQPLGAVGVIVPWSYPLFLSIGPLTGAFATDNQVMIKMNESTPATGCLLKDLLARIFPENQVAMVFDEVDIGVVFSKLPFDHLLFTGATSVGKRVIRAAAENLTPVTLELSGKSPAVVSGSAPMKDAAERIAFGKSLNTEQTCVVPDYVLVPSRRVEKFVSQHKEVIQGFFPRPSDNPGYTAIINERQLGYPRGYLDDAREKGAILVPLFAEDQQRYPPRTLLLDVGDDMKVMQGEVFGPLLPVIPYERLEGTLAYVNQCPQPLTLYYFGYDKTQQQRMLHETHSSGIYLNDTLLYVVQDDIPFSDVGPSGMGHYHDHESFLTFSKAKGVFSRPRFSAARVIYPPYGKSVQKLVCRLLVRWTGARTAPPHSYAAGDITTMSGTTLEGAGLPRRSLMKVGLTDGAFLAIAGVTVSLTGCSAERPVNGLERVRESDLPFLRALLPMMLLGAVSAEWMPKAVEGTIQSLDHNLARLSPEILKLTQQLFDVLALSLTRGPLTGIWGSWENASGDGVRVFLSRWENSFVDLLRMGHSSLMQLVMMA